MPIFNIRIINNNAIFDDGDIFHIIKVLRKKVNDLIYAHDDIFLYDIKIVSTKPFSTKIISKKEHNFKPYNINVYLGIISKKNFETACVILNELNCKSITPVKFRRSQGNFKIDYNRLKLLTRESSKQAKRITPILVNNEISFDILVKKVNCNNWYVAFENEKNNYDIRNNFKYDNDINIIIGPEGGITNEEILMLKKANIIKLTKTILRSENAAFFLAANFISLLENKYV